MPVNLFMFCGYVNLCHVSGSIYKRYHMVFVWLTSLIIISRSNHVAVNGIISFFFMAECYSIAYLSHIFFIHLYVDEQQGCVHVLVTVNSAAMNIGVHVSLWIIVLSGYMPRNGIAGSYEVTVFSFLRYWHNVSTVAVPTYISILLLSFFFFFSFFFFCFLLISVSMIFFSSSIICMCLSV